MRRILYILFTGCMLLSLTACSHDDDSTQENLKEKTVLVYMPWTGNENNTGGSLYSYFLNNIRDIEQAIAEQRGLGKTRLLVYIAQSNSQAALVDITYKNNKCVRDTLKKYSELDVTTETGIRSVLEDAYAESPTLTYAMIVGAHATGWMPRGSTPWSVTKAPRRAFGGQTSRTQADVTTLAQAIVNSSLRKLQFLSFDDCYMSNIETAYALRNATNYLVASTSEIMDIGMPYANVWHYLAATPDYEAVCREYLSFYSNYQYPYGTLSAVDCSKVELLIPMMRTFNATCEITEDELENVQPLDGFDSTVFYDFMDYVNHMSDDAVLTESIQSALDAIVVSTVTTPRLFSQFITSGNKYAVSNNSYIVNTNCGITISDPSTNADAITSKTQTEWWKATH